MDREILICQGGYTFDTLVDLVKANRSKLIFFWVPEEAMINPFATYLYNGKTPEFAQLDTILNEYDVEMITMFSSPPDYVVFQKILKEHPIKNFKFIFWPTYLLHFSYYNMISVYGDDYVINKDFNKLYFNFNNQPHFHRQFVMDYLCRYDLFDYGINTWNRIPHPTDIVDLKCWEMKIQKLDEMVDKESHAIVGGGYNARYYFTRDVLETRCLINLVTETFCGENQDAMIYHTEKTFKNFLTEQPFIVVGSPNQNTDITKYGFEIYDEIFDYSFDSDFSKINRIKDTLINLLILKDKDYKKLYQTIDKKIQFNKRRALDIINNDPYIPESFVSIYKQYKSVFDKKANKGIVVSKYLPSIMLNK